MHKGLRNYFYDELAKSGLKQSDIHKVLGNYMHRHYFCRAGQFNIPTAENYKKLQTTGFFNRTFLYKYLLIPRFYPFGFPVCSQ